MRIPTPEEYQLIIKSVKGYNPDAQILHPLTYRIYKENDKLIGFIAILKISWYATEIRHLYVFPQYRNKGYGKKIVKSAVKQIPTPLIFATITTPESESVIKSVGFKLAHEFINPRTGNEVKVFVFKKQVGCKNNPIVFSPTITN
ncbi:MAG TPA: GNAT family N-acetyltransferase [Aigarchaeota archaeon]|nr:GNAT family N-acetyltransferase [Aigarchaeota archaeon]